MVENIPLSEFIKKSAKDQTIFNTKDCIHEPLNQVNGFGQDVINSLLMSHRVSPDHLLPYYFDWSLQNEKGKIAKRISRYLYNNYGYSLEKDVVSEIGNIAANNALKSFDYTFQFSKGIDWEEGAFGDEGSCFFGGKRHHKHLFNKTDEAYAIKFRDQVNSGAARALIFINIPDKHGIVVFNTYPKGETQPITIAAMMRGLARNLGIECTYKRIGIRLRDSWRKYIWFNGGIAYAVFDKIKVSYKKDCIENPVEVSNYITIRIQRCSYCNKESSNLTNINNGQLSVCSRCVSHYAHRCDLCNGLFLSKNMHSSPILYNDEIITSPNICNHCYHELDRCDFCNNPIRNSFNQHAFTDKLLSPDVTDFYSMHGYEVFNKKICHLCTSSIGIDFIRATLPFTIPLQENTNNGFAKRLDSNFRFLF